MTLIENHNVDIRIGNTTVLNRVNLHIKRGEIVTIVGPNGSGKSTLLRTLFGAIKPTHGSITRTPGLRVGYVPQKLHIDPILPMTVRRFMGLSGRKSSTKHNTVLQQAGLPDMADRQMADLSGGQFQRVLLARALIENPGLLILGEATQGLDQPGLATFYRRIEEIRQRLNCTVLMASHELHVVMSASDRVICLNGHV